MKIIDKYILNEVKMPIIFGVSLFTFIFLIEIIVTMMESIIVKGISIFEVVRMLTFYLPPIMSQTIPMGLFLGVMITFAKFTRNSEATAMIASGMDLKNIMRPILILTIAVTFFIFFLQESIIPRSIQKLQFFVARLAYENPVFQLTERTFIDEMDDYNIYIDKIDTKTGIANGVLVFQKDKKNKFPTILIGKEAFWENSNMVITRSNFYDYDDTGKETLKGEFESKSVPLNAYVDGISIKVDDIEAMSIRMILNEIRASGEKEKDLIDKKEIRDARKLKRSYIVEINRKIAVPLSTIMLGLLGIFLSIGHQRSGKGANFALSICIVFAYITILNIGMVMANNGTIPVFVGVWTPNIILLLITIHFYKKKAR